MNRHMLPILALLAVLGFGWTLSSASAQEKAAVDTDHARRMELARQMDEIRPAKAQARQAVTQIAEKLPPLERDRFMRMVDQSFDFDALEKISIETMAELFTTIELEKMIAYFNSPEGRALSEKLPQYQARLQPEIVKILDKAIMEQRTGGAGDPVAPNPAEPEKKQ